MFSFAMRWRIWSIRSVLYCSFFCSAAEEFAEFDDVVFIVKAERRGEFFDTDFVFREEVSAEVLRGAIEERGAISHEEPAFRREGVFFEFHIAEESSELRGGVDFSFAVGGAVPDMSVGRLDAGFGEEEISVCKGAVKLACNVGNSEEAGRWVRVEAAVA